MRVPLVLCSVLASALLVPMLSAQDAVKTDPKHYTVISENDQVRIIKVHYGPHEKSIMHSHPDAVAIFMSDGNVQFTYPDGKKDSHKVKVGDTLFTKANVHLPENLNDKPFDVILVELKK